MHVKAKFYCWKKEIDLGGTQVLLSPVSNDSDENKNFWAATPSGKLEMRIKNEVAAEQFEIGKEYYLVFTEA